MRLARLYNKVHGVIRLLEDIYSYIFRKGIPVSYFDGRKNVGDLLNEYMIAKMFSKKIYKVKTNKLPHVRFVGSVIGSASKRSYIYGGGSIDGLRPNSKLSVNNIFALRGHKTLSLIEQICNQKIIGLPLGDPAVLLPEIYTPTSVSKKFKIGVIPHFADKQNSVLETLQYNKDIFIIDVESGVEEFVDSVTSCEFVISSSLHGLIIADAYAVPNKQVIFGDAVLGGGFKFEDYYSTTSTPDEKGVLAASCESLKYILDNVDLICKVSSYTEDKDSLRSALYKIGDWHERRVF